MNWSTGLVKMFSLILLALCLGACQKSAQSDGKVLARVDGKEITLEQYQSQDFYYDYYAQLNTTIPDQRLETIIESDLLGDEAVRRKIQDLPMIRKRIQQMLIQELLLEELASADRQIPVSEKEIEDYYQTHQNQFQIPERIHYAHILINLPDKSEGLKLARKILKDPGLAQPDRFAKLVTQYSSDKSTVISGGDLGYYSVPENAPSPASLNTWQTKVAMAAASITDVGGIYPQEIETERGYHVVKLLGRDPAVLASLEKAREIITQNLTLQNRFKIYRVYIEELKKKADIWTDDSLIEELKKSGALEVPGRPPPPFLPHPNMGPSTVSPGAGAGNAAPLNRLGVHS